MRTSDCWRPESNARVERPEGPAGRYASRHDSDSQLLATLVAPPLERRTARARAHPTPEPVCAGTLPLLGLVCALHDSSSRGVGGRAPARIQRGPCAQPVHGALGSPTAPPPSPAGFLRDLRGAVSSPPCEPSIGLGPVAIFAPLRSPDDPLAVLHSSSHLVKKRSRTRLARPRLR